MRAIMSISSSIPLLFSFTLVYINVERIQIGYKLHGDIHNRYLLMARPIFIRNALHKVALMLIHHH
jgi:hypothetical protein